MTFSPPPDTLPCPHQDPRLTAAWGRTGCSAAVCLPATCYSRATFGPTLSGSRAWTLTRLTVTYGPHARQWSWHYKAVVRKSQSYTKRMEAPWLPSTLPEAKPGRQTREQAVRCRQWAEGGSGGPQRTWDTLLSWLTAGSPSDSLQYGFQWFVVISFQKGHFVLLTLSWLWNLLQCDKLGSHLIMHIM